MTTTKVEYKRLVDDENFSLGYNTNALESGTSNTDCDEQQFSFNYLFDEATQSNTEEATTSRVSSIISSTYRRLVKTGHTGVKEFPKGYFFAAISGTLFGITSAISKYMSNSFRIDPIQLALFRFAACVFFSIPHAAHSKQPLYHFTMQGSIDPLQDSGTDKGRFFSNTTKARLMLCVRGLIVAPSISLTFDSLRYLPLSETTVLFFTSTVFTALLAKWILKEPFPGRICLAIFLTFLGVVLFAKIPIDLTNTSFSRDILNYKQLRGCGEALTGAFLMSWVYILARSTKTVHQSVQVFHYALVATLTLSILALAMDIDWRTPLCGWSSFALIAMLVSSFYGQYSVSKSLRYAAAGPASLIRACFDLMVAYIFQVAFFHEIPDWYGIGGTLCIFTSLFCMYTNKRNKSV